MERLPIKSVSVEQDSHNCDIDVKFGIVDGHFQCFYERFPNIICDELSYYLDLLESVGDPDLVAEKVNSYCRNCVDCSCFHAPVLLSDWKPANSFEEALEIVKAHPITPDMTYEERLAAQKARFGL